MPNSAEVFLENPDKTDKQKKRLVPLPYSPNSKLSFPFSKLEENKITAPPSVHIEEEKVENELNGMSTVEYNTSSKTLPLSKPKPSRIRMPKINIRSLPRNNNFENSPSSPLSLTDELIKTLGSGKKAEFNLDSANNVENGKIIPSDDKIVLPENYEETKIKSVESSPINKEKSISSKDNDSEISNKELKQKDLKLKRHSTNSQYTDVINLDATGKKKNADFHTLFPSMPLSELLISDYGCALQKGTLVQGRLYVTKNFVSYHSNLFGWVNRISVPFSEIVFMEKRHVAYVIPSAIQINTLHHKYLFTSFRNRDAVIMQLLTLWKDTRNSLAKTTLENQIDSKNSTPDINNDSLDASYFLLQDSEQKEDKSDEDSKPSSETLNNQINEMRTENTKHIDEATLCPCYHSGHLDTKILDKIYHLPLANFYSLIFGEQSNWLENFLSTLNSDVKVEAWDGPTRKISYVKPLTNPLGPKSTRCIVTERQIGIDFPNYATIENSVESLDVPSGSAFRAKIRICMMNNGLGNTRVVITGGSEWLKSSWLKSAIEKGILEGNQNYFSHFNEAIDLYINGPKAGQIGGSNSHQNKSQNNEEVVQVINNEEALDNTQNDGMSRVVTPLTNLSKSIVEQVEQTNSNIPYYLIAFLLLIFNIYYFRWISTIKNNIVQKKLNKVQNHLNKQIIDANLSESFNQVVHSFDAISKVLEQLEKHIHQNDRHPNLNIIQASQSTSNQESNNNEKLTKSGDQIDKTQAETRKDKDSDGAN